MKQAVLLIIFVAVMCLSQARAQNFTCDFETLMFVSDDIDVRVTTTAMVRSLENAIDFEPFAGDHDLLLGDCEDENLQFTFTLNTCVYPDPDNGTGNQTFFVYLPEGYTIGCIRILDKFNNTEGEDLGGYPFVDAGGIGEDFVQIRFESQEAQGMKFETTIRGFKPETTTTDPTTEEPTTPEPTPDTTPEETTVPPFFIDF